MKDEESLTAVVDVERIRQLVKQVEVYLVWLSKATIELEKKYPAPKT